MIYRELAQRAATMSVQDDPADLFWEAYDRLMPIRTIENRVKFCKTLCDQHHLQAAAILFAWVFPGQGFTVQWHPLAAHSTAFVVDAQFRFVAGPFHAAYDGLALLRATLMFYEMRQSNLQVVA